MSDDHTVQACPHCDTAGHFSRRQGRRPDRMAGDLEDTYYCKACRRSFDETVERQPRRAPFNTGGSTLASMLVQMDADELSRGADPHRTGAQRRP